MDRRVWQAVAGGCTVAAFAVPWAVAGSVWFWVFDLPGWPVFAGLAVLMHVIALRWPGAVVLVAWASARGPRRRDAVG
ncbi:hypothetical protein AB0I60_21690 [Actinosynnema sp. NPDC050436]|uniref:hypothetical protein n=1 Tax=Actinosynnema sp. NPDC050436 TaxID=3155659 RepID=UPI00340F8942